jgi:AcrR family transcriptional regulator
LTANSRPSTGMRPQAITPDRQLARPLRSDAQANRRRVLDAAAAVFAAHGIDAPVEEIAQLAGVGMGTLYRRFPSKESLIEQLVSDLFERVLDAGRQALRSPDGSGLEDFLRHTASLQYSHRGCLSRMWESPVPSGFRSDFDDIAGQLLSRAQEHGLIRTDCTATDLSMLLWASGGIIATCGDVAPLAWQRFLDIALAGLRPGPSALEHPPVTDRQRAAVATSGRPARAARINP